MAPIHTHHMDLDGSSRCKCGSRKEVFCCKLSCRRKHHQFPLIHLSQSCHHKEPSQCSSHRNMRLQQEPCKIRRALCGIPLHTSVGHTLVNGHNSGHRKEDLSDRSIGEQGYSCHKGMSALVQMPCKVGMVLGGTGAHIHGGILLPPLLPHLWYRPQLYFVFCQEAYHMVRHRSEE
jgi:hypothetical protein